MIGTLGRNVDYPGFSRRLRWRYNAVKVNTPSSLRWFGCRERLGYLPLPIRNLTRLYVNFDGVVNTGQTNEYACQPHSKVWL